MANNPPTMRTEKSAYRYKFIIYGVLLIATSTGGFIRSSAAQSKNEAEIGRMGQKLTDIDATVNKVADSSDCPEIRQLAATVNKISQVSAQAPAKTSMPPPSPTVLPSSEPKLSSLSNDHLLLLAKEVHAMMSRLKLRFDQEDDTLNGATSGATPAQRAVILGRRDRLRTAYAARCQQLVSEGNDVQAAILQRLGPGQTSHTLKCGPEEGEYLLDLATKLPSDKLWPQGPY